MDYFASHFLLFGKIIILLSLYPKHLPSQAAKCEQTIKDIVLPYETARFTNTFPIPTTTPACRIYYYKKLTSWGISIPKDLYFHVEPVKGDDGVITTVWWSDGNRPCFDYTACENDCLQIMTSDEENKVICRKCNPASKDLNYSSVSNGTFSTHFLYNDSLCNSITNFLVTSYKRYNTNMTSDYFCCKSDNLCIRKDLKCDNDSNCIDGSDETGCSSANFTPALSPVLKDSRLMWRSD